MGTLLSREWTVVLAAASLAAVTTGSRSAAGLFLPPLNSSTGLGMATIGFAAALGQLAWGAAQPLVGAMADRHGAAKVIACGALLLAASSALLPFVGTAAGLAAVFVVTAVAGAAVGSNALIFGAVNARVADARRGFAAGLVTAGGSAGQLVLAPVTQGAIDAAGWSFAALALAALSLAALPLAGAFRGDAPVRSAVRPVGPDVGLAAALVRPSYWLVTCGFFVCGFHVSFVVGYMPAVIELCGLPGKFGGEWLAVVGLFNVAGSLASGTLLQLLPAKRLLAAIHLARALGVAAFLALPQGAASMLVFGVWTGLVYMATVPPTMALVGKLSDARHAATLLGITMFVHQLGAFFGMWLGGAALESEDRLAWLWRADIALALAAAALHLPIREARPAREAQVASR